MARARAKRPVDVVDSMLQDAQIARQAIEDLALDRCDRLARCTRIRDAISIAELAIADLRETVSGLDTAWKDSESAAAAARTEADTANEEIARLRRLLDRVGIDPDSHAAGMAAESLSLGIS